MPSNRFTNKWALGMSLLSPLHSALVQALASAPQQRWMRMIAQKKRWYIMILYVYIIKYIYKHQNTTSYIIILRYWQYSRENPSCFHLTSLNSITGATNSLFQTCPQYTIRSQTISNHLKPSQSISKHLKPCKKIWGNGKIGKKTSQQHHAPRYPTHKDWVHSCSHSRLTHRYCFLRKCQQVKLANEMHKT